MFLVPIVAGRFPPACNLMEDGRMETKGIEQSTLTPSKNPMSRGSGAKSGALKDDFFKKYTDFVDILEASNLPKDFKKVLITKLKDEAIL